jgi:translation initiation factor eIF-2B subunit epsilon
MWKDLLKRYLTEEEGQVDFILSFQEFCSDVSSQFFSSYFQSVLHEMYLEDILSEAAVLRWAEGLREGDEKDPFLQKVIISSSSFSDTHSFE